MCGNVKVSTRNAKVNGRNEKVSQRNEHEHDRNYIVSQRNEHEHDRNYIVSQRNELCNQNFSCANWINFQPNSVSNHCW